MFRIPHYYKLNESFSIVSTFWDNAEGIAAEPLVGGASRLWIVTDNDFAGYRRTLLLAVDLPAQR